MTQLAWRKLMVVGFLTLAWQAVGQSASAQDCAPNGGMAGGAGCGPYCQPKYYGTQPNLFYNYYTPGDCAEATAALYPSPYPVPPHVGYTYITYQPLMPHEFMYHHHRTYHRTYDGGRGLNITSVRWH